MHDPNLRLFIDDHEIAYRRGLTRFIERPHRIQPNPVLTADHPWEQTRINLWGSVYWDDQQDCFRMWYLVDNKGRRDRFENSLCHATSPDGVTWTRGAYTHVDHPAGDTTSIVYGERRQPEVRRLGPPTVLLDPLEPDPNRRYKLVAFFMDLEAQPRLRRRVQRRRHPLEPRPRAACISLAATAPASCRTSSVAASP